jgi:prepilin-type N-terminal cleavage/methylation domain-containing protein
MVFSHTSCANRVRAGFTLVEYMVAMAVGLLVLGAGLALWAYGSRTCAALLSYIELSSASKNALDRVSQQIRNATRVEFCSGEKLVLAVRPESGSNMIKVTYVYDPVGQTFRQRITTATNEEVTTLLTECTNFQFSVYQRTPQYNSSALFTNAWNTNTAKVVEMRWTCIRKLTGDQNNIEAQASAKVVIRNK